MAEQLEMQSLLKTATQLGYNASGEVDRRAAKANLAGNTRGGNFGGFLNSFLGAGSASRSSAKATGAKKSQGNSSNSKGIWMGVEKPSAKKSRGASDAKKTAQKAKADEESEDGEDADVAAAAEEAAMLIWGLLYPDVGELGGDVAGNSSISSLANALGGSSSGALAKMGATGVDVNPMQAAMETANASAEMNQSAVLAALDELVQSLPPGALEKALAKTAGEMGIPGASSELSDIAEALEAKILTMNVAVPNANAGALLAELAAIGAGRRNAEGTAAEIAGDAPEGDMPDSAGITSLGGTADKKLPASLVTALDTGSGKEIRSTFLQTRQDLEFNLQNKINRNMALAVDAAGVGNEGSPSVHGQAAAGQGGQVLAAGGEMKPTPTQTTPGNAMLDQIANLERIAEMVKMGSRKGLQNLTLQLTPAELGKVTIRVEAKDGVVSAFLKVERPETAAQLSHNLQQLRENLKAQGIEIRELEIKHQQNELAGGDWAGQQQRGNRQAGFEQSPSGRYGTEALEDGVPDEAIPAGSGTESGTSGLNLFA